MFDSIEQLEKQVQEFQENILASDRFLANIEALTLAVKNQQRGYEQASASLVQEIKGYVRTIEDKSETLQAKLSSDVQTVNRATEDVAINIMESNANLSDSIANKSETLHDALAADVKSVLQGTQDVVAEIRTNNETGLETATEQLSLEISKMNTDTERFITELKSANKSVIDSVVQELTGFQQGYIKQLEAAQSAIEEMNQTLNTKYQEFLQRLENTNVDQLFKTCQDIEKSIETKLYLLMGGVGTTAIIAILLLLIR